MVVLMSIFNDNKKRRVIIVGILLIIIFELIAFMAGAIRKQSNEVDLYRKSYAIQAEIETVFLNVFTISDAYNSFITENEDATRIETEEFLNHIMKHENYIKNIAFIEDTTIKFNYPFDENSTSIGIDLSQVDGQKDDVLFVKNNLDSIFVGPVELVQGGKAFILRIPVVSNGEYIGQIAAVIDADRFVSLIENEADKYEILLNIQNPNENPFLSVGELDEEQSVVTSIENTHLNWELVVQNRNEDNSTTLMKHGIRLIGLTMALLIGYYVYNNARLIEEVTHKANHDSLTDDFNRTKFLDDYNKGVLLGKLIAFTDINKFKILNDTLGHQFGDWGLIELSRKFKSTEMFNTYRISGDEFILVSKKQMSEKEFLTYVELFNSSIYNEQLQQDVDITLSIGVIEKIEEHLELGKMLMYLDYAMYDAKKERKTYTLVNDELMRKYNDQKQVEELIIEDIRNNNLFTHYQPIINVKSQRIEGLEVLSRWYRDDILVSASNFIDIVKKIKYIEQVDQNLFNNLQNEYLRFKTELVDIENIFFTINLSAETLKMFEEDYIKFDQFVKNNIIPKEQVIFEISEDINLGIISDKTIDYIKDKGYGLVIDDFGSGVSKLSDVLSGKLLAIKTDKSMIPKDIKDTKKLKAFTTIIKAINASGSQVCIEGVETKEQLQIATSSGATSLQGYLFAKAISFDEIIEFIRTFNYADYVK